MDNDDLYCKVFVDAEVEESQLVEMICNLLSGTSRLLRTISSTHCEIDVVKNDDFDVEKRLDPNEGFLYYRYYLDVEPVANANRQDYIAAISELLVRLRDAGFKAVAACNFEEELPKPKLSR